MSLYDDAKKIKDLRWEILTAYGIRDTEDISNDTDNDEANEEFLQALAFLELAGCAMTKAALKQSKARRNQRPCDCNTDRGEDCDRCRSFDPARSTNRR